MLYPVPPRYPSPWTHFPLHSLRSLTYDRGCSCGQVKPGRDGDDVGEPGFIRTWLPDGTFCASLPLADRRQGDLEPRNMLPWPSGHLAPQKWLCGLPWGLQRDFWRGSQEGVSLLAAGICNYRGWGPGDGGGGPAPGR